MADRYVANSMAECIADCNCPSFFYCAYRKPDVEAPLRPCDKDYCYECDDQA